MAHLSVLLFLSVQLTLRHVTLGLWNRACRRMLPQLTVDLVSRLFQLMKASTARRRVPFIGRVDLHLRLALGKARVVVLGAGVVPLPRLLHVIDGARLHVALGLTVQALITALTCSVDLLLLHLLLQATHGHVVACGALNGHGRTTALLATPAHVNRV